MDMPPVLNRVAVPPRRYSTGQGKGGSLAVFYDRYDSASDELTVDPRHWDARRDALRHDTCLVSPGMAAATPSLDLRKTIFRKIACHLATIVKEASAFRETRRRSSLLAAAFQSSSELFQGREVMERKLPKVRGRAWLGVVAVLVALGTLTVAGRRVRFDSESQR